MDTGAGALCLRGAVTTAHASIPCRTESTDDRVKQTVKRFGFQTADLLDEQFPISREQLAGTRVADDAEGAFFKV